MCSTLHRSFNHRRGPCSARLNVEFTVNKARCSNRSAGAAIDRRTASTGFARQCVRRGTRVASVSTLMPRRASAALASVRERTCSALRMALTCTLTVP